MIHAIDFAEGKISVNDEWFSIRELSEMILEKLENGENDITDYADALRDLDAAMKFWF
ncbi:MAG: hypothetical protein JSV49_05615 [Thermoplasmata archaeon]|nr:MAG: hypothetical protein JSV49_05615 [Thermoplasmata archaeon]